MAFYGKDVILEKFFGYVYKGYFPKEIWVKRMLSFQSGIMNWWQKYLKWYLVLKFKLNFEFNHDGNWNKYNSSEQGTTIDNNYSGFYVLGFLLSLAVFICQ